MQPPRAYTYDCLLGTAHLPCCKRCPIIFISQIYDSPTGARICNLAFNLKIKPLSNNSLPGKGNRNTRWTSSLKQYLLFPSKPILACLHIITFHLCINLQLQQYYSISKNHVLVSFIIKCNSAYPRFTCFRLLSNTRPLFHGILSPTVLLFCHGLIFSLLVSNCVLSCKLLLTCSSLSHSSLIKKYLFPSGYPFYCCQARK